MYATLPSASMTDYARVAVVVPLTSLWLAGCVAPNTPHMQEMSRQLSEGDHGRFAGGESFEARALARASGQSAQPASSEADAVVLGVPATLAARPSPPERQKPSRGQAESPASMPSPARIVSPDLTGAGEAFIGAGKPQEGRALLVQAAEAGNVAAQRALGRAHLEGSALPHDSELAATYLAKAADRDDAYAAQLLGEAYLTGEGMEQDPQKADAWLTRAAEAGRLSAQATLGRALLRGDHHFSQDTTRGRKLLLSAAIKGHAGAQATLGRELIRGEHIQPDIDQGVEYLIKAAQQGHPTARLALAKAYLWANGLENASQQQALLWLDNVIDGDSEMALETMRQLLTGQDKATFTIL
ncbi:sel1 repeat family protein [Halomonas sp. McH1-25]|uniref:tetratricopeptide repeat protein n=1 Tax=unclassified Halomonas TaxID=2609666 RepID=UPI001EF671C3|nr:MULTISPECIES: tetratricopeptide repeat protein [unclassified Halomonas]MCG7600328.1 sel1 repeat family protein [Halomonas sp. McH1-25]MCP1342504.1 sel1 repeat family protein [Halomonas sp. FL8]MCP1359559.1 sel1 repeat family protein [Halomonas sp. BBD45]